MTEYWKSTQNMYWCEYCKVWVKDDIRARTVHEGGTKHKLEVAKRMRSMQKKEETEKKQAELAKKTIGTIEMLAQRQYEKDLAAGLGAADVVSTYEEEIGPAMPSQAAAGAADATKVADETTWVLDKESGYYYNARAGYYFHKDTGMYYGGEPAVWIKELPAHLKQYSYEQATKAQVVSASEVVKTKTSAAHFLEIKKHPMQQIGGFTMSTVQGGTVGAARGLAGAVPPSSSAPSAGAAAGAPAAMKVVGGMTAAQVLQQSREQQKQERIEQLAGQKRKKMEESMDPAKLAKLRAEEEEAQKRREAAKARLNQRTANFYGMK